MSAAARVLAENILRWSAERIDGVTLALRLADVDRAMLKRAYGILEHELIPRLAEADVDEFYRVNGRYMTNDECAEILKAPAPPRPVLNEADWARLERLVKEVAETVCAAHPRAGPAETERQTRRRFAVLGRRLA